MKNDTDTETLLRPANVTNYEQFIWKQFKKLLKK